MPLKCLETQALARWNSPRDTSLVHYPKINPYNSVKKKKPITILIGAEKTLDKIQCPFMIKTLRTRGIEGNFINLIKSFYRKPTSNVILSSESPCFPSKTSNRVRLSLSLPLFGVVLEVLASAARTEKPGHL